MLEEMKKLAETGYQQMEKLSIIPLVVIGLVILNRKRIEWLPIYTLLYSYFIQLINKNNQFDILVLLTLK